MRQPNISVVGDLSTEIENAIDEKLSKFSISQKNQKSKPADQSDRPLNNKVSFIILLFYHSYFNCIAFYGNIFLKVLK